MGAKGAGPQLRSRSVDVVFLIDVSGSMLADAKIQSLNAALEEALPFLRRAAAEVAGVESFVRVVTFGSTAAWTVDRPVPLEEFWWDELAAEPRGLTELGAAIDLVRTSLSDDRRALPPALILVTDGMPTDTVAPSFDEAIAQLDAHPVGRSSSRVAIGIGQDASVAALETFVAATRGEVLRAHDVQHLANVIGAASFSVMTQASELAT